MRRCASQKRGDDAEGESNWYEHSAWNSSHSYDSHKAAEDEEGVHADCEKTHSKVGHLIVLDHRHREELHGERHGYLGRCSVQISKERPSVTQDGKESDVGAL